MHHDYQHAANARENALMADAAGWDRIARSESVPYDQGYAAFKKYRTCWKTIGRGGDAQQLYALLHEHGLPTEKIITALRLAGFPEHAGFIRDGEWIKIDDEEPLTV